MDRETKEYIDKLFEEFRASAPADKPVGANGIFKPTIAKWFRDENGNLHGSVMAKAIPGFGPDVWAVWENTRKTVTKMCGKSRVEHIRDVDKANRYADAILQTIYDLMTEDKEHG